MNLSLIELWTRTLKHFIKLTIQHRFQEIWWDISENLLLQVHALHQKLDHEFHRIVHLESSTWSMKSYVESKVLFLSNSRHKFHFKNPESLNNSWKKLLIRRKRSKIVEMRWSMYKMKCQKNTIQGRLKKSKRKTN